MKHSVLVTGAGGFIGRSVVEHLAGAGVPVRAGLRRSPAVAMPGAVVCDLDAPETVDAACRGAGAIVHAAGRSAATMPGHLATLLAAADRAGVAQVVLFSSIAVYGDRTGIVGEDDAPGRLDAYGEAKRDCEGMLQAWVARGEERRAVILRPGIVYGRGSDLWIARPAAALRAGVLGPLGSAGEGTAALIHVADVAEATHTALDVLSRPGPAIATCNLVGPDTPTWNAYHAALARSLGLRPRAIGPYERRALRLLSLSAKLLARLRLPAPGFLLRVPAAGEWRLFARAALYQTARAERLLGFRAATGIAAGLALSVPDRRGLYAAGGENSVRATANAASPANAPAAR